MSLQSGIELLAGVGGTTANNLFDANMQRLDEFARVLLAFHFHGEAQADVVFFKAVLPWDVYVEKVIFNAHFGPPTGANLIAKVKVNGAAATKNFTLTAGQDFDEDEPAAPTDILATAGQALELYFSQVGSTNPGTEIKGWLQLAKRKL